MNEWINEWSEKIRTLWSEDHMSLDRASRRSDGLAMPDAGNVFVESSRIWQMTSCVTRNPGGKCFFFRISAGPLFSHKQEEVKQMGRKEEKIN